MFLTKLLLNKEITEPNKSSSSNPDGESLQFLIKDHLVNISQKFTKKEEQSVSVKDIRTNISNQGTMNQQILDIIQKCQNGNSPSLTSKLSTITPNFNSTCNASMQHQQ